MKRQKLYLIIFFLMTVTRIFSQNISGIITDSLKNQPLPGVLVELPELHKGTQTDDKGYFEIKHLPAGVFKLQITFPGYKTEILQINTSIDNNLKISLLPTIVETQKVVVSGGNFSAAHTNAVKVQTVSLTNLSTNPIMNAQLRTVPGVDLITKGNGVTKPVIRGLTGTNILVLNNGFRLENYQFSENHPFLIDENGSDRIEIIKGPASLLYGSDAIGGVINYIAEKPAQSGKLQIDYNSAYFSNGNGFVQNLGLKNSSDKFMFGVRAGVKSFADFTDASKQQVLNSRFNRYSINSFAIFSGKKYLSSIYYDFSKSKFGMTIPPALPMITDNLHKNEYFYQDLENHFVGVKNSFFLAEKTKLKANFSYQNNNRQFITTDISNPAVNMTLQTASYETKLEHATNKITLISGLQGYIKGNKNLDAQGKIIPDYFLNTNAAFVLFKWNAVKNMFIQTGVRYEKTFIKIPSQDYFNIFDKDTSLNFSNLSGSIGATYKVAKWLNFRTNFATAYRMPNLPELAQYGIHGNRFERGNMNLKSQRSYETDFSMHVHSRAFLWDFAVFYNKIDNYIYLAPTKITMQAMQVYQYMQNNADIYGFETGVEFHILQNIDYKTSFAYIQGVQDDDYLPFIPQNKINSSLIYRIDKALIFRKITLQLNYLYAFAQNKVSAFEQASPAYQIVDASLGFSIFLKQQELIWTISCTNIFNEKYIDHLSTLKDVGFYEQGRSVNVILTIKKQQDL